MSEEFVKVAYLGDLQPGSKRKVDLDGQSMLVANIDGTICAIADTCTHRGCSLSKGSIDGNVVTCPCHSGRFDLKTGKVIAPPPRIDVASFDVQVEGSDILVKKKQTISEA